MNKLAPSVKEFHNRHAYRVIDGDRYCLEIYKKIVDGVIVSEIHDALRDADYLSRMIEIEYGVYTIFKLCGDTLVADITEELYNKLEWIDNTNLIK